MNLIFLLFRRAPGNIALSILLGGLSGVTYSLLIPLVTSAVNANEGRFPPMIGGGHLEGVVHLPASVVFCAACLFIVVGRTVSQILLTRASMDVASDFRVQLYDRVERAPLPELEKLGSARLVAALTTDVPRIVMGAELLPILLSSIVTLAGMLGYLFYLNASMFWFVLGCILFGVITYQIPIQAGNRFYVKVGQYYDALLTSIEGLIRGIKELKLNDRKRREYFEVALIAGEKNLLSAQKAGNSVMSIASSYGEMLCFFVIGAVVFVFVRFQTLKNEELVGVVMTLLYVAGPISNVLNVFPQLAISKVSLQRLTDLLSVLPPDLSERTAIPEGDWKQIRFEQLSYQHEGSADSPGFAVGPLDLEFLRGQITLVVGGNGSGKSTLSKLLTLQYPPLSGKIYFDDTPVNADTAASYRQYMAAIYADYYLFDRIYGAVVSQETVDHYLALFGLDKKVSYRDGKFSTLSLSDGQRHRLALVAAFVEDKELYVFDEWAADQDPVFKEVFYYNILPSLKARGKCVVAITHDDRYFHIADKVVVLADGLVDKITMPSAQSISRQP